MFPTLVKIFGNLVIRSRAIIYAIPKRFESWTQSLYHSIFCYILVVKYYLAIKARCEHISMESGKSCANRKPRISGERRQSFVAFSLPRHFIVTMRKLTKTMPNQKSNATGITYNVAIDT